MCFQNTGSSGPQLGMTFPPGVMWQGLAISGCHDWEGAPGMLLTEARDVANILLCTGQTPRTKTSPLQHSSTAEVGKPGPTGLLESI